MTNNFDENINEEDLLDDDFDMYDDMEMMTAILQSASKSANNLTSLVVENNHRNNVAMSSEDIYDIFRNSFIVALTTVAPAQSE